MVKDKIDKLKIREVRHKLGSHSNDFINYDSDTIESYVPVRIMLTGFNCTFINNETLEHERVNLKDVLEIHLKLMIELLDEIYEKSVITFYKGNKDKIEILKEKLKYLRIEKEGGLVIETSSDGPIIFISTMKEKRFSE